VDWGEFGNVAVAANVRERQLGDVVAELTAVRAGSPRPECLGAAARQRRAPQDWTPRSVRAVAHAMPGDGVHPHGG